MFANMTVGQLYRKILTQLQQIYTASESGIIADWIFEKRLQFTKGDTIKKSSEKLEEKIVHTIEGDLKCLLQHEPIQYVVEEAWFYKMKLSVNKHVLIPRPETEELAELIVKTTTDDRPLTTDHRSPMTDDRRPTTDHRSPTTDHRRPITIIDIGTGSGCIAIALKKHLPGAIITAIDISPEALLIANKNALSQQVSIDVKQIDFLDNTQWPTLDQYNIIVSNPPYIPINEKENLDKNVTAYEPGTALFVPENEPLLFYKKIVAFAKDHLTKNGKIFVEVHENFANEVFDLFSTTYSQVEIKKDMYGKNRMVTATRYP